ncbi:hypothetical protein [Bradyrhizobium sp. BWC-3-1]|uniref:hypothetical protein n=1 Tax=Bradyrhizobium sp. BWC-3-1 TaxID=3080012 RepID=UPI00293E5695|nr:hypothetical protein [Bradyrhizobium sp. BWC-3-1]WOH57648.1 hypothetical protein RX329_36665 [Bradyrhizobium sp. BWC-3-1]
MTLIPRVCLPDCRAIPTSACATYSSIPLNVFPDVLINALIISCDQAFYRGALPVSATILNLINGEVVQSHRL